MRVGLNAYVKSRGLSGSATGARAIEAALSSSYSVVELSPVVDKLGRARTFLEWLEWDRAKFEQYGRSQACDALINLANTGRSSRLPLVTVLHDTMVLDHWRLFDPAYVLYSKLMFGRSLSDSDVVVVPSEHSRVSAMRRWPELNPTVIPWPAPKEPTPPRDARQSLMVVVVASADKHKRLPMAVSVMSEARRLSGEPLELLCVSKPGNDQSALMRAVQKANESVAAPWVQVRSSLEQADLEGQIARSLCVLSTSLDEGFCLPLVEAGCLGVPVVHSGRGAMSEVAPNGNDWGIAPDDSSEVQRMAEGICRLLEPEQWAQKARDSSDNAKRFPTDDFRARWKDVLRETLAAHA